MRFATIVAATASLFLAQQAGASPSSPGTGGEVVDGHLHLLTAKRHAHGSSGGLPNTRRHHAKKSGGLKKVRRAGYCKPKSSGSSSSSSASPSATPVNNAVDKDDSSSASSSSSSSKDNTPTSSSSSANAQPTNNSSDSDDDGETSPISSGSASSLGSISAFGGVNSGVGSWFRTNAGSDSTNGQSWCETWYKDDWKCFAPSVGLMLDNYGGDRVKAGKAYCGREVKFTNPNNGKTAIGFICDGFDDRWAKRSGNSDLTIGLFNELTGKAFSNNKNDVIMNLQWELTGGVVTQGKFQEGKYSQKA